MQVRSSPTGPRSTSDEDIECRTGCRFCACVDLSSTDRRVCIDKLSWRLVLPYFIIQRTMWTCTPPRKFLLNLLSSYYEILPPIAEPILVILSLKDAGMYLFYKSYRWYPDSMVGRTQFVCCDDNSVALSDTLPDL